MSIVCIFNGLLQIWLMLCKGGWVLKIRISLLQMADNSLEAEVWTLASGELCSVWTLVSGGYAVSAPWHQGS